MLCAVRPLLGMLLLMVAASARADLVPYPAQVDFGWQAMHATSEPMDTTLKNTGSEALTVTAVMPASGVYARAGGTCGEVPFTIAPQSNCTLKHTFTPTSATWYAQTLTVTLAGGTTIPFGLYGQSEAGFLNVSPMQLSFPPTPVGSISGEQTATFLNTSHVRLVVTQMGVSSNPPNSFVRTGGNCPEPPFEVTSSWSCNVAYTFAPNQLGSAAMNLYLVATSGTFLLMASGEGTAEIPLFKSGFE